MPRGRKGTLESGHGAESVGPEQSGVPSHWGTPIVADDCRGFRSECIKKAHHVAHEVQQRIRLDGLRTVALAVAAHVRGDDVKPRLGEGVELVSP